MGRDAHPPAARGTALDWRSVTIPAHVGVPLTDSALDARVYVLDTSVLLSDPRALQRFAEHEVVIPLVVLAELEGKRHHPELGWAAREVLRMLEDLRLTHGSLLRPMPANAEGGTLRVEVNHTDTAGFPAALSGEANDHRILAVGRNLAAEGRAVTVVTSDLPCNTGVVLHAGSQSALGRVHEDKRVHLARSDRALFEVRGRSAEQRLAIDLLSDHELGIVSLGGPAGTRKSVLALAAGLDAVLEQRTHNRVIVFRPIFPVGGQDLGYLPGSESEKMLPWGAAVADALEAIAGQEVINEVFDRGLLEVLPLTHIRGRSLTGSFVVIDEAQNLERTVLLTALSRLGQGSRVILTHDVAQRDNLRVGRHDGIASVIESLKGHPLFGHVTLTRAERSPVAALVTQVLDGAGLT